MHPANASISFKFRGMKEDIDISESLTILEVFALIVDLSLTDIRD